MIEMVFSLPKIDIYSIVIQLLLFITRFFTSFIFLATHHLMFKYKMTQNIMFLCVNQTVTICELFMEKWPQINPHPRSQDRIGYSQALTHTYALSPPAFSTGASNINQATFASRKSGRTSVVCESSKTLCWKKDYNKKKKKNVCGEIEKYFPLQFTKIPPF